MMNYRIFFVLIPFLLGTPFQMHAQPKPGDVYQEYSQHVGMRKGWRVTDPNPQRERAYRNLPNPVHTIHIGDLDQATKVEVLIDRWGGHVNTYEHRIRFNENDWITVPGLKTTPPGHEPEMYHYQDNPIVEIPLSHLKEGQNTYEGTCRGTWWGQWGMYSVILRVYYDPGKKPHVTGRITAPAPGNSFGEYPEIAVETSTETGVARVDVLAYYDGVDVDGDGVYQEFHANYHQVVRGQPAVIRHHVGSSTVAPYRIRWDTRWVPDQEKNAVKLLARIQDNKGYWSVTETVKNLTLVRNGTSVKLYKPYDVPERFAVRQNRTEKSCKFTIPEQDDLQQVAEASLHLRTWHGYDKHHAGMRINDWPHHLGGKGHHYSYNIFQIPAPVLKSGENRISFHSDTEHHGCEVLWPGPMVVVRYGEPAAEIGRLSSRHDPWLFQEIIVDQQPPQPKRITDAEAVDINLDGKLDLWYSGSHVDSSAQQIAWYENTGDPQKWQRYTPFVGPSLGAGWGDVDGDGDFDLITAQDRSGNKTGNFAFYWMKNPLKEGGDPGNDVWERFLIHPDPEDPDDVFTFWTGRDGKRKSHLDLNHDGRLDIVVAAFKKTVWYLPGPKNPENDEWKFYKIAESDERHGSAALGDINNDGHPDLVWGRDWYANPGDPTTIPWKVSLIDTSWTQETQVELADLDNDGWLDVVLTGEETTDGIAWYKNPASASTNGSSWQKHIVLPSFEGLHSLKLADFDKDGDLDIMAAEMHHTPNRRVVLIENLDIEKNKWISRVISFTGSHKAKVADLDNDGDLDIYGKNYAEDTRPRIWLNPNNSKLALNSWQRHVIDDENASRYIIRSADLNQDGRLDIITGTGWYRNPGKVENAWQRFELGEDLGTAHIVYDFDRDGDLDIFGEGFGWARNDGNETSTMMKNIPGKGGFVQGAALLSDAAAIEIAYTYKNGDGIHLITVPEDPSKSDWSNEHVYQTFARSKSVDIGDVDRDGDPDILFSGRDGDMLQWLANDRMVPFKAFDVAKAPSKINHRCQLADLNNDGRLDAVFGHKGRLLNWYEQGASLDAQWVQHIIADSSKLNFDPLSLDIADMDLDGDLDVVVGEHVPRVEKLEQCRLLVYENNDGRGLTWKEHLVYQGDEHHQGAQTVDIDGDGDLDILSVGWKHSKVLLYENTAL